MNKKSLAHIESVLGTRIRPIFEKAAERIDALKVGEKVPATELAKDIGKDLGMTGPQLYPTLLFLLKEFPDVEIRKGAHGGVFKLAPKDNANSAPESDNDGLKND